MEASELRDRLIMARRSQGWLADQVGVRPNTVWRWVSGKLPIPATRDDELRHLLPPANDWRES
jgi:DNA-binding transcriptional regulator YdaS (Cro superfamily)